MDIKNLLIPQDYSNKNGSGEVITQVPIRKPFKTEFVRVHRDKTFSITPVAIFEDRQFRCTYMIAPSLVKIMSDYYNPATLVTAISKQGAVFLWPLKLPKNGRDNAWFQTAREAAEVAKESWIRVMPDHSLKRYKVIQASGNLDEPRWPAISLEELLDKASTNSIIDREDHPVIQRLRGLI